MCNTKSYQQNVEQTVQQIFNSLSWLLYTVCSNSYASGPVQSRTCQRCQEHKHFLPYPRRQWTLWIKGELFKWSEANFSFHIMTSYGKYSMEKLAGDLFFEIRVY